MWEQSNVFSSGASLETHMVPYACFENSAATLASCTPASAMLKARSSNWTWCPPGDLLGSSRRSSALSSVRSSKIVRLRAGSRDNAENRLNNSSAI